MATSRYKTGTAISALEPGILNPFPLRNDAFSVHATDPPNDAQRIHQRIDWADTGNRDDPIGGVLDLRQVRCAGTMVLARSSRRSFSRSRRVRTCPPKSEADGRWLGV
jgi:hypothetical protein